jgi:hypothetical protein
MKHFDENVIRKERDDKKREAVGINVAGNTVEKT